MANVLILDGHTSASLAFVRSLGKLGHRVTVGYAYGAFSPASYSTFCSHAFEYVNPIDNARRFVSDLVRIIKQDGIKYIIPMSDVTIWPLAANRNLLGDEYSILVPSLDVIDQVADKYKCIRLAQMARVPVPDTILISDCQELSKCNVTAYPIVIKDRYSVRWSDDVGICGSVIYANSYKDLMEKLYTRISTHRDVLLQNFIAGVGIGFSCYFLDGKIYVPFQWQRIREKDPKGSGSSARISQSIDRDVYRYSELILRETSFNGICMVEFKRSPTGKLVFMEINGRPWGSIQLAIHAGVNYPKYLMDYWDLGNTPPVCINYKQNIICRWLAADLTHLENLLEGKPDWWPSDYPSFWGNLIRVSVPWHPRLYYDDISLSDPKPGFMGIVDWFKAHISGGTK